MWIRTFSAELWRFRVKAPRQRGKLRNAVYGVKKIPVRNYRGRIKKLSMEVKRAFSLLEKSRAETVSSRLGPAPHPFILLILGTRHSVSGLVNLAKSAARNVLDASASLAVTAHLVPPNHRKFALLLESSNDWQVARCPEPSELLANPLSVHRRTPPGSESPRRFARSSLHPTPA